MDDTTLEGSIREESVRAISAIEEKAALQIRHLDENYAAEMGSFRKQVEAETKKSIQQELSKLSNKAILENRKLKLLSCEQFINRTVDKVVKGVRRSPQYEQFLLDAVRDIVAEIPGGVEVRLKPEDLAFGEKILTSVKTDGLNQEVVIKGDPTIRWGGCLVFDEAGGRIFNNTLERIYFKKSLSIRCKVMEILMETSQEGNKTSSVARL